MRTLFVTLQNFKVLKPKPSLPFPLSLSHTHGTLLEEHTKQTFSARSEQEACAFGIPALFVPSFSLQNSLL